MKRWESTYTVQVETVGVITAYFATCKICGEKSGAAGKMDAYFAGARHKREAH